MSIASRARHEKRPSSTGKRPRLRGARPTEKPKPFNFTEFAATAHAMNVEGMKRITPRRFGGPQAPGAFGGPKITRASRLATAPARHQAAVTAHKAKVAAKAAAKAAKAAAKKAA